MSCGGCVETIGHRNAINGWISRQRRYTEPWSWEQILGTRGAPHGSARRVGRGDVMRAVLYHSTRVLASLTAIDPVARTTLILRMARELNLDHEHAVDPVLDELMQWASTAPLSCCRTRSGLPSDNAERPTGNHAAEEPRRMVRNGPVQFSSSFPSSRGSTMVRRTTSDRRSVPDQTLHIQTDLVARDRVHRRGRIP